MSDVEHVKIYMSDTMALVVSIENHMIRYVSL